MSRSDDNNELWILALVFVCIVCGFGWYFSEQRSSDAYERPKLSSEEAEEYEAVIDRYQSALSEANSRIEESSSCARSAFELLDYGYYDDALREIDDCGRDTVWDPGAL